MLDRLECIIPKGKENAIHQEELARRLGTTADNAKKLVRLARAQGLQILSGKCGYWIAENDAEKSEFVNLMRAQAFSRLRSAKPIRNTLNNISGQISLFDAVIEVSEKGANNE